MSFLLCYQNFKCIHTMLKSCFKWRTILINHLSVYQKVKKCICFLEMDLLTQPCSYCQYPPHIFYNWKPTKPILLLEEKSPFVHQNDCHPNTMLQSIISFQPFVIPRSIFPCFERISFIMFNYDDVVQLNKGFIHNVFLANSKSIE